MGANDANLDISYHPEQSPGVIDFAWHHGEHRIEVKASLSRAQWSGVRMAAQAARSDYEVGRQVADLLGVVEAPIVALIVLGRRVRELLGS